MAITSGLFVSFSEVLPVWRIIRLTLNFSILLPILFALLCGYVNIPRKASTAVYSVMNGINLLPAIFVIALNIINCSGNYFFDIIMYGADILVIALLGIVLSGILLKRSFHFSFSGRLKKVKLSRFPTCNSFIVSDT